MIHHGRILGLALFALIAWSAAAFAEGRMIIVMDGSGSMWGQIEGRAKLEIARDAVRDVLKAVPPERDLGLLAYGHRQKGNCDDIELIVPPESNSSAAILDAVQTMRFLGKTPLTKAVRVAADSLRFTEEEATVVLVTDGIETCEADPCALGAELAQLGLKFTAHVIGFGLTQEEGAAVACLAENTGGRYIRAADADGLVEALKTTINDGPGSPTQVPAATLPAAGLIAPEEAPIGSEIEVAWSVTVSDPLDTIEIGTVGTEDNTSYVYAESGNPAVMQMPGTPGPYELRYVSSDQHIIARRPISATEAPVSLSAPEQAVAGQLIPVGWVGPDAVYDNIRLRLPGDDSYIAYQYVAGENPVLLTMPDDSGTYELAYVLNDAETIATRPITVLPAGSSVPPLSASLTAPDQTEVDSDVQVGWSGPGAGDDYIMLRLPGSSDYFSYDYVRDNNPVTLATPATPGEYELIYRFADGSELARRNISIVVELAPIAASSPVAVTFDVPPAHLGTAIEWSAAPQPGQKVAPEAWAMNEVITGPVSTSLEPGIYDVQGNAGNVVFAGTVTVRAGAENHFIISPVGVSPETPDEASALQAYESLGMGEDTGYFCEQSVPCAHSDLDTGLSFLLPAGWHTDFPIYYETPGGAKAEGPTMTIYGRSQGGAEPTAIVLNPHQWIAMNGPCTEIAAGTLCRFETDDIEALSSYEILKASLRLVRP